MYLTPDVPVRPPGTPPTPMNLDFYRRALALAEKYRRPGIFPQSMRGHLQFRYPEIYALEQHRLLL
jgi:hypothetical protein